MSADRLVGFIRWYLRGGVWRYGAWDGLHGGAEARRRFACVIEERRGCSEERFGK